MIYTSDNSDNIYIQNIAKNGIPFALTIPGIPDEDTMSETELDAMLERGYQQSLNGETTSAEEIFARLMELE